MNARTQKSLGIGLAVVLLVFVLLIQALAPSTSEDSEDPSVASYDEPGRRAAFLLLGELGFSAQTWQLPPSSLPRSGATLILPVVPRSVFGRETSADVPNSPLSEAESSSLDVHLPVHYRRFLDSGGVLMTSADEEMLTFLLSELEIESVRDVAVRDSSSESPSPTILAQGEALEIEWMREFVTHSDPRTAVWAVDEDDVPHVVVLEVGLGELVLFADGSVLSNSNLREGDEGLLFVRAIEEFDRSGLVLFDEYAFGLWSPMSQEQLAFSGDYLQVTVQFLLLILLLAWRFSWIGRFPRDPEAFELVSPVLRVSSGAHLLERARRYDLLGNWLVAGVLARALRLWRLKPQSEDTSQATAASLDALGARAGIDSAEWRAKLCEREVGNAKDLQALEESLAQFEQEVIKTHSPRRAREKVKTGQ